MKDNPSSRNDASPTPEKYVLGPDSQVQEGVPQGTVTRHSWTGSIYPGTTREFWVYVPAQYDPARPACVMVFQDGWKYADPNGPARVPIVFDNLIHKKEIPVTIGIFINPGSDTDAFRNDTRDEWITYPLSQRALEYDSLGDRYARFLQEEILPEVERQYRLTENPEGRAIGGVSSGGLCAWTVAWERPDAFRKVLSHVGSFCDIRGGYAHPFLIRKAEPKPIRVFLQAATNDLNCPWGDWFLANETMVSALKFKGYDYHYVVGAGGHCLNHGGAILPESLRWLWRDYPK